MKTKEIFTRMENVSPNRAKELLGLNISNRPLNQSTVDYYARQMRNGEWTISGQTISVSDKNTILDGQHRLAAVVNSGVTILFNIAYNVPSESFVNYDNLRTRGLADALFINNAKGSRVLSGILFKYVALNINHLGSFGAGGYTGAAGGGINKRVKPSNSQMLRIYENDSILFDEIVAFSDNCYRKIKLLSISQIGAYCYFLIKNKKHSKEKVFSFFHQLFYNENVENQSIYNLREKLIIGNFGNYKMVGFAKHCYIVKCWNAYVLGREIKNYRQAENDLTPEFI